MDSTLTFYKMLLTYKFNTSSNFYVQGDLQIDHNETAKWVNISSLYLNDDKHIQ